MLIDIFTNKLGHITYGQTQTKQMHHWA